MKSKFAEFRVSNDAIDDDIELRRRIGADGYVFFRKLQDPDRLWKLRLAMLAKIRDGGWLLDDSILDDGIADVTRRCTEGDREYTDVYHEVYKLQSFHEAAHWPEVLDMMRKVVGDAVLPHPQKIARIWFPKFTDHTTPAHQDFVHFQGSYDTYTCWTPVGDCPIELGGLAILPGTHKHNSVFDHHFSLGAGSLSVDSAHKEGEWVTTNYEIGDCLIFHSLTLHQALPNLTTDKMRVSLDNRYQSVGESISDGQLQPHLNGISPLTWEEVYAGWSSLELQYYWRNVATSVVANDPSYKERGFTEAVSLAQKGDLKALLHLKRVIGRDPLSDQAKVAKKALDESDLQGRV